MEIRTIQNFDWKNKLLTHPEHGRISDFKPDGRQVLNFAVETDATDSATSNISNLWKTIILADIVKYAQEKAYLLNAVKQIIAEPNVKSVKVPINTSNLNFDEQTNALATTTYETEIRDWTELTNLTTVEFSYQLYKYGTIIAKEVLKSTSVDLIAWAKAQLANDAVRTLDTAIGAALGAATPAATKWGGDAGQTSEVDTGDILTTDMMADAVTELDEEGWENTPDQPYILFISAKQKAALLKDSQFVNASEYGSNAVVATGEVGTYLGAKVIVTPRLVDITSSAGTSAAATRCMLVKSQVCGGLVWFEKPTIDGEYNKRRAAAEVYMDMAFATDSLQDKAIVWLEVSDA